MSHQQFIVPIFQTASVDIQMHSPAAHGLWTAASHEHQVQFLCGCHPALNQMLIKHIHFELSFVFCHRAIVFHHVEVILQNCIHILLELIVCVNGIFLQNIFQTLWLFHHAAACVSIKQSGKTVLHIIEPALNDLRLRISDDSICHIDSQAFEYARRFKGFLAILWFLLPVAKAANIEGQELSTVIHVDVIRDAIFQDSLPERDQRCL